MTTKTTEAFTQKAANRQQKKPLSFMLQSGEITQRIWQQKGWTGFIDQKESSEYKCFNVEPFVILSIFSRTVIVHKDASISGFTRLHLSPDYSQLKLLCVKF